MALSACAVAYSGAGEVHRGCVHKCTPTPADSDRRGPCWQRAAPVDERQGRNGLRRPLRRQNSMRAGLQVRHMPQLPPSGV